MAHPDTQSLSTGFSDGSIVYTDYIVGFFDLLGQANKLSKMKSPPKNQKEKDEFSKLAKETLGAVKKFRTTINDSFHPLLQKRSSPEYDLLNKAGQQIYDNTKSIDIKFQGFSDSIVIYAPVFNSKKHFQFSAIHALFSSAVITIPFMLANKVTPRGAIEFGYGVELNEKEIYGYALHEAYRLENKIAKTPRIVIGNNLFNFLNDASNMTCNNPTDEINNATAKLCLNWIKKDTNGTHFLHYLQPISQETIASQNTVYTKALDFIRVELKKHQACNDEKLIKKYSYLLKYFLDHPM